MIAGQNVQSTPGGTRHAGAWRAALVATAALLASLGGPARMSTAQDAAPGTAAQGDVERGRYLTHSVAMCVQCHSPRNADGTLDETRLFQGAAVPLRSPFPRVEWAMQAPSIAGLVSFDAADELSVLTTGRRRDGYTPKPPMPPFRLSEEDARAVIAYLRSLPH